MNLKDYRTILMTTGLIGILLIATPALSMVIDLPSREAFSELYILDHEHKTEDFPFNIITEQNYSVYVDTGNYMGSSAYYLIYVKFGSINDPLPNSTTATPSTLQPLYEYDFVLEDGATFERALNFSVVDSSFSSNRAIVKMIDVNGFSFNVNKQVDWNAEQQGFYYRFLVELWRYNPQSTNFEYAGNFVYLQLNLTRSTLS